MNGTNLFRNTMQLQWYTRQFYDLCASLILNLRMNEVSLVYQNAIVIFFGRYADYNIPNDSVKYFTQHRTTILCGSKLKYTLTHWQINFTCANLSVFCFSFRGVYIIMLHEIKVQTDIKLVTGVDKKKKVKVL